MCYDGGRGEEELPEMGLPVVVKADGLAAGKGVVICQTHEDAEIAATQDVFRGDAG